MADEEFLCARCARQRQTCCQTSEVYATPGDVARIARHTGRGDFVEFRPVDDPRYGDQDDDPVWRDQVFRDDGTRRVLRRTPAGDCTFLGTQGCTLPMEVRPLVCRIYPYDYDAQGLKADLATGCPLQLLPAGQTLLQALDMRLDDAQRWRRQLYEEIKLEGGSATGLSCAS